MHTYAHYYIYTYLLITYNLYIIHLETNININVHTIYKRTYVRIFADIEKYLHTYILTYLLTSLKNDNVLVLCTVLTKVCLYAENKNELHTTLV